MWLSKRLHLPNRSQTPHDVSKFKHRPLDQRHAEIRVLQVLSREDGKVSCRVKHISLEAVSPPLPSQPMISSKVSTLMQDQPLTPSQLTQQSSTDSSDGTTTPSALRYKALSYTWGTEAASEQILLDGAVFYVRPNLYAFLKAANGPGCRQWLGAKDFLWIDALCIDQDSIEERNHQVKLMSRIYSNAQKVIMWLGRVYPAHNYEVDMPVEQTWNLPREKNSLTKAVSERPYWTRLWIVQEVLLAADVTILMNDRTVEFEMFQGKEQRHSHAASLYLWRYLNRGASSKPRLIQAAEQFGRQECKETKDKLFALLSIIADGSDFPVDYSDTLEVVFWKALIHFKGCYGGFYDDDAIAAGRTLRKLFGLKGIPSPAGVSPTSLSNPVLPGGAISTANLFPIRLNVLGWDVFSYFDNFPSIHLCACASCKALPDFDDYFASTEPLYQRSNYLICRTVSISNGTLMFQRSATGEDDVRWRCVAFGTIRESSWGKEQLTLFPPPGNKRFWVGPEVASPSSTVSVESGILLALLRHSVRPAHGGAVWKVYTQPSRGQRPVRWKSDE